MKDARGLNICVFSMYLVRSSHVILVAAIGCDAAEVGCVFDSTGISYLHLYSLSHSVGVLEHALSRPGEVGFFPE